MEGGWGPKRVPQVDFGAPLGGSYEWGLGSKVSSKSGFWSLPGGSYGGGLGSKSEGPKWTQSAGFFEFSIFAK